MGKRSLSLVASACILLVIPMSAAAARSPLLVLGGRTHLPSGMSGKVSVVAQDFTGEAIGPNGTSVIPANGYLLLVLRNNTARTVYDLRVTATIVATNGTVLASKQDVGAQPIATPSRGLAIDILQVLGLAG